MIQPGNLILNRKYHILRLIGEGSFTRAWLAEEVGSPTRRVAIKEPRPDHRSEERLAQLATRFRREVDLSVTLGRGGVPNFVPAFQMGYWGASIPLLVVGYAEGGSLVGLISQYPNGLPVEQAVQLTRQICRTLAGFHALPGRPVHRNVKASNILLSRSGEAMLSDFGLTCWPHAGEECSGAPGPGLPDWTGDAVPAAQSDDLSALGCVLFEMLTGAPCAERAPDARASALRADLPGWLDDVIARARGEDPWSRYARAEEMLAALGAFGAAADLAVHDAADEARRGAQERARRERLARSYDGLQAALRARRWREAVRHCDAIAAIDADYRDVGRLRVQAESGLVLERAAEEQRQQWQVELGRLYESLQAAVRVKDWPETLRLCARIEGLEPGYRGIAQIEAQAEAKLRERREAERRQRDRSKRVAELSWEVEQLERQTKYRAAADKVAELRRLDPGNPELYNMDRRVREAMLRAPRPPRSGVAEWLLLLLLVGVVGSTLLWGITHRATPAMLPPSSQDEAPQVPAAGQITEASAAPVETELFQPTALPAVLSTQVNATPRPRATARRTPVPATTATPTEVPGTSTPPPILLAEPANGIRASGLVVFRWAGSLRPGEVFDVRVCSDANCRPEFGKTNTTDTSWIWCPDGDPGVYRWQVAVIDDQTKIVRGGASRVWEFTWDGGNCGRSDEDKGDQPYPAPN